jgi:hypothetical protein
VLLTTTDETTVHNSKKNQQQQTTKIMGLAVFCAHAGKRMKKSFLSGQDIGVALALYFVYPAILYLLIDKFHGICGADTYVHKHQAVAANNAIFL